MKSHSMYIRQTIKLGKAKKRRRFESHPGMVWWLNPYFFSSFSYFHFWETPCDLTEKLVCVLDILAKKPETEMKISSSNRVTSVYYSYKTRQFAGMYKTQNFVILNMKRIRLKENYETPRRWNRTTLSLESYRFEVCTPDHRSSSGHWPWIFL